MANFVLIHGAWHGGCCYRDTAKALRAAGHNVFTPTHTGVGERAHQSAENITLETHIRDVCGVIEAEELSDVILCGHSYGGMVITGVADRLADAWDPSPFRHYAKSVEGKTGWRVVKMPSSHDVMVDMPLELAAELAKLA